MASSMTMLDVDFVIETLHDEQIRVLIDLFSFQESLVYHVLKGRD
jgi:hypothetical protein